MPSKRRCREGARILVLLVFCSGSPVASAETLSRGEAVARALSQNPQLAAARAVEMQAEARYGQSGAAASPTLTVAMGVGPSIKAEIVPGSAVQSTENTYGDVGLIDLSVVVGGELTVSQHLEKHGRRHTYYNTRLSTWVSQRILA